MPLSRLPNPLRPKNEDGTSLATRAATPRAVAQTLPYGLVTLAEGTTPAVDVVAVHGLDGHREKSWTLNDVNWLRDLLPTDIPNARIMSWGYDARTHSISQIGGKYIYDHGRDLISDLCLKRTLTKTSRRPILFVAHSLGGIVLKSALIHSESARKGALEDQRSIKLSTYGVIFMGSPHQGAAGVHIGELVLRIASIFIDTDNRAIKHLKHDSEWLQQQLQQFAPISQEIVTKFAYEVLPTTSIALGKKVMIVPQASAVLPGTTDVDLIAIPADHVNMVKFASRQDLGYERVSGHLQLMAEKGLDIIRVRWEEQSRVENALANMTDAFSMPFSLYDVPEVDVFVGRKTELSEMHEAFLRDGPERRVVVLHGLGGMGKTQLAVKYMKEHKNMYSAVFWLNGSTEDTLKQSFAVMAKRLYREHEDSALLMSAANAENIDDVVANVRQWLSMKENYRWMLVIDNLDNPKTPDNRDPQAYDIRSYFPEVHHGSIIITTRSSYLKIGKVISLRKLQDLGESIALLTSMSGRLNLDQDPYATQLAERLDGLPLALATAGAYLSQVPTSLQDYLRHYTDSWLSLQEASPGLLSYQDRTLYTTWNLSFEKIQNQNKAAAQLLQLLAYFDDHDVWYQLLAAGKKNSPKWFSDIVQDELSFNNAMRPLCDHALVEPLKVQGGLSGGYGMHSCVHDWTRYVLKNENKAEMGTIALSCIGSSIPREKDLVYWAMVRRLLPHGCRFIEVVSSDIDILFENDEEYFNNVDRLGRLFYDQRKLKEAAGMYRQALDGTEKLLGPDHLSTLRAVRNMGDTYRHQGKFKQAEVMYQRALDGMEKALGPDHPSTLQTVNNLGVLYDKQGKLKEAEVMYQRALEGQEKALGPDHTTTLETVNNLGLLYGDQGRLKEAEVMYQRALAGKEKALGQDHTSTLDTVNNLGVLYWKQGKLKEAEVMCQRALDGYEKALGLDHPSTLGTVKNLGLLYDKQGKAKEAKALFLRVGMKRPGTCLVQ